MFEFAWPWMLLTLPLPWLARRFLSPVNEAARGALRVPDVADFSTLPATHALAAGPRAQRWLLLIGWGLLVIASANPRWLGEPLDKQSAVDDNKHHGTQASGRKDDE